MSLASLATITEHIFVFKKKASGEDLKSSKLKSYLIIENDFSSLLSASKSNYTFCHNKLVDAICILVWKRGLGQVCIT